MLKFSGGLWQGAVFVFCMVGWAAQALGQVQGTATYRERMALPPDAVFEATLEDVSKADAPAEVIGQARLERPGNPPFRFEIAYDPARIIANHRYVVRARILAHGKLLFITDQSYPVLTGGQGNEVTLLLRRGGSSGQAGEGARPLGTLPATFVGDLPCADCPGIRHQLELFPDQAFFLRMTYLGKDKNARFDDIGSWVMTSDQHTLVLFGGQEAPLQFAIKDANTLRKLDREGHEIASSLNYDLRRAQDQQPLENTYWKLTHLGDVPVTVASQQREPHFILHSETRRLSGLGGCNRLVGSYEQNGDRLTFGQMAGTMMACLEGGDTEKAFLEALRQVHKWKIMGQHLELFDASSSLVARFEARHMQ